MLKPIALSMLAWLNFWGQPDPRLQPLEHFAWDDSAIFNLPTVMEQDIVTDKVVQAYLSSLVKKKAEVEQQGIWIQSGWNTLGSNQGKQPLPAASLTKIATTLAALDKWGAKHQFSTKMYLTAEIENGVVQGDLVVEGSGDPFFVWEEAIALGNALEQLGIKSIRGNLLITDEFYMNYQDDSLKAGKLLQQALDQKSWRSPVTNQYLQMPVGTSQPQVAIAGQVKVIQNVPANTRLLITHQSLPLGEILRQMNIYSNNKMAQMLADLIGGAAKVANSAANIANFPSAEIKLINGSGLGEENLISPRAVCQMLIAIDRLLKNDSLTAKDLFPTAGKDLVGTVQNRGLPLGTTVKTGTLNNVSALAGVIPTKDQGDVYFSIINYGRQYEYFRQQQDWLLNELAQGWELMPNDFSLTKQSWFLGDPSRNFINEQLTIDN